MKPVTRARNTSTFTWYGDANAPLRTPLSQWQDLDSSNGSSADDFSDAPETPDQQVKLRGTPAVRASYESDMSDVGECDDRRRFRDRSVKVSYDSDSCLTPRSRRTLRRTLSGATEPWPSVKAPAKPTLDTIFSPTHEILHPLQSLRLEQSSSNSSIAASNVEPGRSGGLTSATLERFTLPKPQSDASEFDSYIKPSPTPHLSSSEFDSYIKPSSKPRLDSPAFGRHTKPSPKPRFTPVNFESYTFPEAKRNSMELDSCTSPKPQLECVDFESYTFQKPQPTVASTLEEEKLEQKKSLIRSNSDSLDIPPLSVGKEEKPETGGDPSLPPNVVVIIVDAEKKLTFVALDWAINVAVRPGDEIVILGVLKHILSPSTFLHSSSFYSVPWLAKERWRDHRDETDDLILEPCVLIFPWMSVTVGFKMLADTDPLYGVNREVLQLEVTRTTDAFQSKLSDSGRTEECEKKNVSFSQNRLNRMQTVNGLVSQEDQLTELLTQPVCLW
jgi:hypothetical protein